MSERLLFPSLHQQPRDLVHTTPLCSTSVNVKTNTIPWLVLGCMALAITYSVTQPLATYQGSVFLDAEHYYQMAQQSTTEWPIQGSKPFIYRIGLPWLAGQFSADNLLHGFYLINAVWGLLTLGVFFALLELLFTSRWLNALLSVLFIVNINSPFRFNALYPIMTDPPFLFFSTLLIYLDVKHQTYTSWTTALCTGLSFIGVFFREVTLLAPVASCLAYSVSAFVTNIPWTPVQLFRRSLPVVAGGIGILLTHHIVIPTGEYTFLGQTLLVFSAHWDKPLAYPLGPFLTYGPLLFLPLFFAHTATWQFCKAFPVLPIYGRGILLLTLVGGYHGVRFFFWGYCAVLPLIGATISDMQRYSHKRQASIFVPLVLLQILACHPFGVLPDVPSLIAPDFPSYYFLFPYGQDAHYAHLWPHAMSEGLRQLVLYQYAAIGASLFLLRLFYFSNTQVLSSSPTRSTTCKTYRPGSR